MQSHRDGFRNCLFIIVVYNGTNLMSSISAAQLDGQMDLGVLKILTSLQNAILASGDDNLCMAKGCVTDRMHVESSPELSAQSQIPKTVQGLKLEIM